MQEIFNKTTPKVQTEKFKEKDLVNLFEYHKVSGSGVQTDPYIIESSDVFPKVDIIAIKKSNLYIQFRNHDLRSIKFKRSSNITIKNCNSSNLQLLNCSEVKIFDSTFDLLEINNSVKISIHNSKISYLKLFNSFLNEFDNCSIKRIDKHHSPDNTLNIEGQLEDKDRKSNIFQNNVPSIIILFLVLLVCGDILFFSFITYTVTPYTLIIISIITASIISFMVISVKEAINLQKKLKKYYNGNIDLEFNNGKIILGCGLIILGLVLANLSIYILYTDPLLWLQTEITTIYLLSLITIASVIITIGINSILRNMRSFRDRFVKKKSPVYPLFLLYNIFYALILSFMYISAFLFNLNDAFLIIAQLLLAYLVINFIIAVFTKFKLSKSKESSGATRSILGIFLVGSGGFTFPLLNSLLPVYIYYLGLLNFPQIAIYYFLLMCSSVILALFGIISFPKTSKFLSAVQYSKKEKYTKSIKSFRSALRTEPYNEIGLYNLGMTYYKNEEYAKSVETLKKVLTINQNSIRTLIGLGYAFTELGDFESAINSCEKAIHLIKNPVISVSTKLSDIIKQTFAQPIKEESAWQALSYVYSVQNNYEKVVETAKKALKLNPRYKEALLSLAYGYTYLGEYDKAIEACNSALDLDSRFGYTWHHLGRAYHLKGDLDLAFQMFEKAVKLSPNEHRIRLNLAKLFLDKKEYSRALEEIDIALKLKPNFQDAIEVREQILTLINEDDNVNN
ncbi:MAG: hypothetical protein EAX91_04550 [Candidatus Lokiarchaeota archaeon]|nr:hypothetical protein [Candidatus Lokiarchaeota archaeon]